MRYGTFMYLNFPLFKIGHYLKRNFEILHKICFNIEKLSNLHLPIFSFLPFLRNTSAYVVPQQITYYCFIIGLFGIRLKY